MRSILEFPAKRPKPELALANLLKKHGITDFGTFGMWFAPVFIGINSTWTPYDTQAKIDTGASISLFPEKIADDLNLTGGLPYEFYGVVRKKICRIDVKLHTVDIKIVDFHENEILLNGVWIAFTSLDRAPVLLGYKSILEKLVIGQKPGTDILTLQLA